MIMQMAESSAEWLQQIEEKCNTTEQIYLRCFLFGGKKYLDDHSQVGTYKVYFFGERSMSSLC